jgi:hypothetical protein
MRHLRSWRGVRLKVDGERCLVVVVRLRWMGWEGRGQGCARLAAARLRIAEVSG